MTNPTDALVDKIVDRMYRDEAWSSFWSREEAAKLARACLLAIDSSGTHVVVPTERMRDRGIVPNRVLGNRVRSNLKSCRIKRACISTSRSKPAETELTPSPHVRR